MGSFIKNLYDCAVLNFCKAQLASNGFSFFLFWVRFGLWLGGGVSVGFGVWLGFVQHCTDLKLFRFSILAFFLHSMRFITQQVWTRGRRRRCVVFHNDEYSGCTLAECDFSACEKRRSSVSAAFGFVFKFDNFEIYWQRSSSCSSQGCAHLSIPCCPLAFSSQELQWGSGGLAPE